MLPGIAGTLPTEPTLERIRGSLTPILGDVLTRASIRVHCQRLGIDGAQVATSRVARLLAALEAGMRVFVGGRKAREVIADLERSLLEEDG